MANKGWVCIYRQIQDCWVWSDKPFARGQAWIDLILSCNHEDKKIIFDGKPEVVGRGSWVTSMAGLAEKWGWSRHKVSDFLKVLESEGMVTTKRDTKRTVITIEKYDVFQDLNLDMGHQKDITGTSEGHQTDIRRTQTTMNNNDNNENNIILSKTTKPVRHKYGEYQNVLLTDEDYSKLTEEFPVDYLDRIERLSSYIASTGKTYKNHLATIRNWARKETAKSKPNGSEIQANGHTRRINEVDGWV